jgi:hypothetical protein
MRPIDKEDAGPGDVLIVSRLGGVSFRKARSTAPRHARRPGHPRGRLAEPGKVGRRQCFFQAITEEIVAHPQVREPIEVTTPGQGPRAPGLQYSSGHASCTIGAVWQIRSGVGDKAGTAPDGEAEHAALRTWVDAKAPATFCYPTLPQSGALCAVPSACLELLDTARGCAQAWSDHACS